MGHLHLPCANFFDGDVVLTPISPAWDQRAQGKILENHFHFSDNARGIGAAEMARAIRHKEPARVSAEMAFHVLEVFEGLYRSNEEHTWVEIESRFERPTPMPDIDEAATEEECFEHTGRVIHEHSTYFPVVLIEEIFFRNPISCFM